MPMKRKATRISYHFNSLHILAESITRIRMMPITDKDLTMCQALGVEKLV